jgi:outer membrane receptor protein involved in Fe transport
MKRDLLMFNVAYAAILAVAAPAFAAAANDAVPNESANTVGVAEVVVTAQKREERLEAVPASILAARGQELQDRQITTNDQLMLVVPDLRVGSAVGALAQDISIRGIGPANNYNNNVEQPVGLYMDEIYQTFGAAPGTQLFDLQRIEVLKGPQGTLYGRNTTGGAINYISQKPSLEMGVYNGEAEVGYGSYDRFEAQGATDLTLIDHVLGARIAIYHEDREGYVDNVGATGPKTFGSEDMTNGRFLLKYAPTGHFDATFGVYVNDFSGSSVGNIGYGIFPNDSYIPDPNHPGQGLYSRAGLTPYQDALSFFPGTTSSSTDFGLTMNWYEGPLQITSISSYEHSNAFASNDCDSSPIDYCDSAYWVKSNQVSQDLRAEYTTGKLRLTAGATYGWDEFDQTFTAGFGGVEFLSNSFEQKRTSYGAFVDGTYSFTDKLDLTLGIRDTEDQTKMEKVRTLLLDSFYGSPIGMTIPTAGPYIPDDYLPTQTRNNNGVTGRAILSYKFTPDIMTYASYSHGYRAGAFNGLQFLSPDELNFVGPEEDDDVEVGLKATLWRRLTLNLAAYDIEITNQQVQSEINIAGCPTCTPPVQSASYPALAGLKGYSRGVDLDAKTAFTDSLTGSFSLTLSDTKYASGPNQTISGTSVAGKHFAFAPDIAIRAGLDWVAWREGDQKVTLSGDVGYTGRYWFDPTNGANEIGLGYILRRGQDPYATVDARLAYQIRKVRISLWANNIFDQFYVASATNAEASYGSAQALPGEPRTFGATLGVRF